MLRAEIRCTIPERARHLQSSCIKTSSSVRRPTVIDLFATTGTDVNGADDVGVSMVAQHRDTYLLLRHNPLVVPHLRRVHQNASL